MGSRATVHADEVTEKHSGKIDAVMTVGVRFPRTDIPVLVATLKEHNAEGAE